jgi:hypothetical protein
MPVPYKGLGDNGFPKSLDELLETVPTDRRFQGERVEPEGGELGGCYGRALYTLDGGFMRT